MNTLATTVNRKWILTTILVILASVVMARLGIWQLDRLVQRKAFNAHYLEQSQSPPLDLNKLSQYSQLGTMAYRRVQVTGYFDHSQEVAIRNQSWNNQSGVHLLTPLVISGMDHIVLVDRGWIPLDAYQSGNWDEFNQPGLVQIHGILRLSQAPTFGGQPDPTPIPGERLEAWNFVNIPLISRQFSQTLLPVYIQQSPEPSWNALPYRTLPDIQLDEGPHLSYAIQWFAFTAILALGYPYYVHKQEKPGHSTEHPSRTNHTSGDIPIP
jgi:surfeit locus 1 family protein